MAQRQYTYIAGDWDHDKDAVNVLEYLKSNSKLFYLNVHDTKTAYDGSLNCSIKKSLKERLDISRRFVLIVGDHTSTLTRGGCQLCASYNSFQRRCAKGYSVDYNSFVKYECEKAAEANLNREMTVLVLYKNDSIDRNNCPESVRWLGKHVAMIKQGGDGKYYWDYNAIINGFAST